MTIHQPEANSAAVDWIPALRAAQSGDARAFDAIVRRFQNSVIGYAYHVLGDFHLSHDVAQETFLQAWRDLPNLNELAAFPAWLRRITFKYCDRARRRRQVVLTVTGTSEAEPFIATHTHYENNPARLLLKREEAYDRNRRISDALATLTPGERIAVTLFYFGERNQDDTAAFLGVTALAVRKRLQRARERMKGSLIMLETELTNRAPSRNDRFVEVAHLLRRVTDLLENDGRVVAAYLAHFGSDEGFGGEDDAYSSLNIHVVVRDENLHGFAATRHDYVSEVGEPLLFVEGPQNAPAEGGYYLMAVYDGEAGPYETDWYWHGAGVATIPADTRVLFDRANLPRQTEPTAWGYTEAVPPALLALQNARSDDEKRAEELRNNLSLFWAMWLISAKYIARDPDQEQVPFLPMLRNLLHAAQTATGVTPSDNNADEPARPRPLDKLARLRALGREAEAAMPKAAALGAHVAPEVPNRAYRFADMVEAQLASDARGGTIAS